MPAVHKDLGAAFLCVPLRNLVTWLSVLTTLWGVFCIIVLLLEDVRYQLGGYNQVGGRVMAFMGWLGIAFGMVGQLGVYDEKVNLVTWFNGYQFSNLAVYALTFASDYNTLLNHCWADHAVYPRVKFNPSVDILAMKGLCPWARQSYLIGFSICFTVYWYTTWCTRLYVVRSSTAVPYPVRFASQ